MWRRFLNPRVLIFAAAAAVFAALVAVAGFLAENWLLVLLIALVLVLAVLGVLFVRMMMKREREERLESGLGDDSALDEAEARAARSASGSDVRTRFRDALAEVKRTIGVYEVPWLLVMGPTGSGKSALLRASGLHLPAQYAHSRVFGPTQTCDFFLFNEAIAVDTAGRYTDGESEADRDEWSLVLGQLRRSRAELPLNGVVFAIPAATFLTASPPELEEQARQMRRRLNEIEVLLGVEAPVYLVLTKADQLEGASDVANALPPDRRAEAFGWTSDQWRLADPAQRVIEAFSAMRARLDGFLHELLLREPDPRKKRRIFTFPQDLEELGRSVARFVATAFKRDIYNPTPFLRGVYLASAESEGEAVSPTLSRLGMTHARTAHGGDGAPAWLGDLFGEIIVGDEELAVPKSRMGPRTRRALQITGGLAAAVVLTVWGFSFAQNYAGTHELERDARLALSQDPSIQHVNQLRDAIERREADADSWVNTLGFGHLGRAVEDAKRSFVWSFGRNFDSYARANLEDALQRRGDSVFRAAVAMATDLEFLASGGQSGAPDFGPFLPRRADDGESYQQAYTRYVAWMGVADRKQLLERQSGVLSQSAAGLLSIGPLEDQTMDPAGRFAPVCYAAAGLPAPETSTGGCVPGIYTKAGHDNLFERLMSAVEETGALPERRVRETRRRYVDRFDRSWRRYLLDTPTAARSQTAVRNAPQLVVLEQIHENLATDLGRDEPTPAWIELIAEVKRTEPANEEETVPPWTGYSAALDSVALEVEDATTDPELALALAKEVGEGESSSFDVALRVVREVVPRQGDASARGKVREILEAPILDGFSAVADSALRELDRRWDERVASRYGADLSAGELGELYDPSAGVLASFTSEELGPLLREGAPVRLLEDRTMPFGPQFLAWMENANTLQRRLFSTGGGSLAVRLRGVPSSLEGAPGLRVKRRDLRLICPDEQQNFAYREGSGDYTFRWSAACQSLVLRILVGGEGTGDRELVREWKGPQALPTFLQQGQPLGRGVVQWTVDEPDGLRVRANYQIESGGELREIVHRAPPRSLRN